MALLQDRCICLRKVEYSETSQILLLFARGHGVQRVIAKGAHRRTKAGASKFDGGVDLLDVGNAVFTQRLEKDLGTLTEWALEEWHPALHRNLRGMYLGLYAAELIGLLIEEHDPHPELFDRLETGLMEFGTPRAEEAFLAFQLDLLRETGYLPEFGDCCSACHFAIAPREPCYFSAGHGGIVCQNCERALPDRLWFDTRLLGLLHTFARLPRRNGVPARLPELTRRQTDPINRILAALVQHNLGRGLRMVKYVV